MKHRMSDEVYFVSLLIMQLPLRKACNNSNFAQHFCSSIH